MLFNKTKILKKNNKFLFKEINNNFFFKVTALLLIEC